MHKLQVTMILERMGNEMVPGLRKHTASSPVKQATYVRACFLMGNQFANLEGFTSSYILS